MIILAKFKGILFVSEFNEISEYLKIKETLSKSFVKYKNLEFEHRFKQDLSAKNTLLYATCTFIKLSS